MIGLLRAEAYRLTRLGVVRAAAALLLLAAVVRGVVWPPSPDLPRAGLWSFFLVAMATIVVTAVTVGQEFSGGTFRGLAVRGVARWQFLAARFVVLAALADLLLVGTEGLATWLGVRPALDPGELLRAWLSLWPHIALVMLFTVLARSGGIALLVGVLQLAFEQAHAAYMGPLIMLPEAIPRSFRIFTHLGLSGTLYQWSLSYNSANWTYLAEPRLAPMPVNLLLLALPNPALRSGLILVGYTLLALGLSTVVLYRRDVTETVAGRARLWGPLRRRRHTTQAALPAPTSAERLPLGTGYGSLMVRLVRAHLFRIGRSALVRISVAAALLFPLALWGISALGEKVGAQVQLWVYGAGGAPPLAFVLSLIAVGPLSTVISALAVSNELTLGTRRAELTRGVGRRHSIVAQSLGLVLVLGAVLAFVAGALLLIGANLTGAWHLLPAVTMVATGILGAGAYTAIIQAGGALTRAPVGALLFGLGFLVADWMLLLAPTSGSGSGLLSTYSPGLCILAVGSWGRMEAISYGWQLIDLAPALLLLMAYTVLGHLLAVAVARYRDA